MLDTIKTHWEWVVVAVSTAFGVGVVKSKVALKSELYNPDGSQIYVPKNEFEKVADKVEKMNYTLGQINQFMKERIK